MIPGNAVKPAGLPMPSLTGTNDTPAGFGTKAGCVMFGSGVNFGTGKNLLFGDGVASATDNWFG